MPGTKNGSDQRERDLLADAIGRRSDDIDERWLERVAHAVGGGMSPTELRDSMPEYLQRLTEGLRSEGTASAGGSSSWDKVARAHATTRVRLGFDIDQLVGDFIVLRQVLFDVVEEEGLLIDTGQARRISDLIEGAIAAAVKSYVEARDFELRRQEAEHLGFITHELRNPLTTAILGTAQLRRLLKLTPDQERMLATVERNQKRLAELIDGVLLVERDAHGLKPKLTTTTLGQLIAEPIAAARLAADAKGLHLETSFDPDLVIEVDPKLTRSAIDNVVQNAVKYTDHGDIELVVEDNAGEMVVHVRDTGPGIPAEELRTIFEPFRRGEASKLTKPGSGLGLAIARRAVEVQGGSIHAEPSKPKGSHFWLTLPKPRH